MQFKLDKIYKGQVYGPYRCITSPELEILYILAENKYQEYLKEKSQKKPSKFIAEHFKTTESKIKSARFFEGYWNREDKSLEDTLREYKRISPNKKDSKIHCIADLLK